MKNNEIELYIVHAFSTKRKGGSPTGVVLNGSHLSDQQRIDIVRALEVSHVGFVDVIQKTSRLVVVRFFTVAGELMNCGHGTIAVHVLLVKRGLIDTGIVRQRSLGGTQTVKVSSLKITATVYLKLSPIKLSSPHTGVMTNIYEALGLLPADIALDVPSKIASAGTRRFLIPVVSLDKLRSICPVYEKLSTVCKQHECIGVFVYYLNERNALKEATGRFFAPVIGVREDIINGNSSGCLGRYLLFRFKTTQIRLKVIQGESFNSRGEVRVSSKKVNQHYETWIGGTARSIIRVDKLQRIDIN